MSNVVTKNQYVYSQRKNATYKKESVIEFFIPPSIMLENPKQIYLVMDVKLTGKQYKGALCSSAGAYSLFRTITIDDGTGATNLETLDGYAYLMAHKYNIEYMESTEHLKQLHEGKPNKNYIGNTSYNQYCDAKVNDGNHFKLVRVTLPLYLSGLFKPTRNQIVPGVAHRGFRLRFELNNFDEFFEVAKAPVYERKNGANVATGTYSGYSENDGYVVQADVAQGTNNCKLMNTLDALPVGTTGILNSDKTPAHLFSPGQHVYNTNAQKLKIQSVSIDGDNRINLTFTSALNAQMPAGDKIYISSDASDYSDMDVEVTNVVMNIGSVQPPEQFLDSILDSVQKGKLNYDITSYTLHTKNIPSGSRSNTLVLNTSNRRAKALICIPVSTSVSPLTDTFRPIHLGNSHTELLSYQLKLYGGLVVPDRMVPLSKYNDGKFDAICLREQMLSSAAAGFEVNNIKEMHDNFFYGRRLALKGYSYDTKGQITLEANFSKNGAMLMHCFLIHKRQLQVSESGSRVVY